MTGEGISRRQVLLGMGAGATMAWVAPVVTTAASAAAASAPIGPMAGGSATIVCDGSGGYTIQLNGWNDAPCGIKNCVSMHEQAHNNDWKTRYPNGCKDKPAGTAVPTTGDGYAAFLKMSECNGYTTELACIKLLMPDMDPCKTRVADHLDDTARQKARYCS
jgi:hypothetical protein